MQCIKYIYTAAIAKLNNGKVITGDKDFGVLYCSADIGKDIKAHLRAIKNIYDYILIDCPPSLGISTINAINASNEVIVLVETHYLALRGAEILISQPVKKVKKQKNKSYNNAGELKSMLKIENTLLEKIIYLEEHYNDIVSRFLEFGACSTYEKLKKDCGIIISILDKLIVLAKQYKNNIHSEEYLSKKYSFEEKVYKVLNAIDPNDSRDIFLEITSLKESSNSHYLINALIKMYKNYAISRAWKYFPVSIELSKKKFIKQAAFQIKGSNAFRCLKYENGLHSAVISGNDRDKNINKTVVFTRVYPDIGKKEVKLKKEELKIETFHASSHGGQSVNTADSAVRITHIPSKISISSQGHRSQTKNKETALGLLRARLVSLEEEKLQEKRALDRKLLNVGYLNKDIIRTYDFRKNILFDSRLNNPIADLENILDGNLSVLMDELLKYDEITKINYLLGL